MDETQIGEILVRYFTDLFTSNGNADVEELLDKVDCKCDDEMRSCLDAAFNPEEVRRAINQMHPTKAPGPDCMSPLFYQKFWEIVGNDVVSFVIDILNNRENVGAINQTYIVLIPKKKRMLLPC